MLPYLYSPHWTTKAEGRQPIIAVMPCLFLQLNTDVYIPNEKSVHVNTVVWSNKQLWPYIYTNGKFA